MNGDEESESPSPPACPTAVLADGQPVGPKAIVTLGGGILTVEVNGMLGCGQQCISFAGRVIAPQIRQSNRSRAVCEGALLHPARQPHPCPALRLADPAGH